MISTMKKIKKAREMEGWRLQSERQGKLQKLAWEIKAKEGKEVSHVDIQREDYSRQKNSTNVLK